MENNCDFFSESDGHHITTKYKFHIIFQCIYENSGLTYNH